MKKIYRILFLLVALIGYSSCNYIWTLFRMKQLLTRILMLIKMQ